MAYKIWVTKTKQFVDIVVCFPYYLNCYSNELVTAKSYISGTSTLVNVDTTVTLFATWYGDLGGVAGEFININSGSNCGSATIDVTNVSCGGEFYSYDGLTLYTFSSATQEYTLYSPVVFGGCTC